MSFWSEEEEEWSTMKTWSLIKKLLQFSLQVSIHPYSTNIGRLVCMLLDFSRISNGFMSLLMREFQLILWQSSQCSVTASVPMNYGWHLLRRHMLNFMDVMRTSSQDMLTKESKNSQDSNQRRSWLETKNQVFSLIKWLSNITEALKDSGTS